VPPRKKKSLVIVESPAKAKTINKYLGADFTVLASYGHVRDLPRGRRAKGEDVVGINIDAGWVPRYVVTEREEGKGKRRSAKDILNELKKEAGKSAAVYLATDPDREGEAIAWHIEDELGLDDKKTFRITFNEITKGAVQKAIAKPTKIDMDLVKAQEARRMLDRVVGYPLSGLLSKKLTHSLSAGRVQSVALRLVVDREREITAFQSEEYWDLQATVTTAEGQTKPVITVKKVTPKKPVEEGDVPAEPVKAPELPEGTFVADLAEWQGKKFEAKNEEQATAVANSCVDTTFVVSKVEQKDKLEKPHAPFTTSTLQQQASLRLHYPAKKTMMVAQKLYEGVDLGPEGSVALITYMRTDSVRVSEEAIKAVRSHIGKNFGDKYLPTAANHYASDKSAQEGHEAIRPTDVENTPERVKAYLPTDQFRLYELIYNRFVASQMTPAIFSVTNIEIKAGEGLFKSQGKILKFDGYRRIYIVHSKQEDTMLPQLVELQPLTCLALVPAQHFTQPPARYNEASLVKTLEKEGIGRPSTYATIISKIQERGYVEQKERRFYATELGIAVTDLLVQNFPNVLDVKFTSQMETDLDRIENAKIDWKRVLNEFYKPFARSLKEAETKLLAIKDELTDEICPQCGAQLAIKWSRKTKDKFLGCSRYPECKYIKPREGEEDRAPQPTEHMCPDCGKPLLRRMGKYGPFLACSGYPECKTIMNFDAEGKPVPSAQKTEHKCEKCGSPMVIRQGKRGPFLACSAYPKCKNAKDVDKDGNPVQPLDTGVTCVKCGGPMVIRRGPRGPFLGCAAYPKCRSTQQLPADLKEKVKEMLPASAKKPVPEVEVQETCPECGGPMKARRGPRGFFLGCAKYPKCKGKRDASPDVLEQLQEAGAM
jgi:DNA topoisomerase-1